MLMPVPVKTEIRRRWRFDLFADIVDVLGWVALRREEGHRVRRCGRSLWASWDMDYKPSPYRARPRPQYPKQKIDHCRHCDERRTFVRGGTGDLRKGPRYRGSGMRNYQYTEAEPRHTCAGLLQAQKDMAESQRRMTRMLNKILQDS